MNHVNATLPPKTRAARSRTAHVCLTLLAWSVLATPAGAGELKVGHTVLRSESTVQIESIALPQKEVRSDRHAVYNRRLVRLSQAGAERPSYLVIEELGSRGGIFEWKGICSGIKPSAELFLHMPLRRLNDQCVLAFESDDLGESLGALDKVAAQHAELKDWKLDSEGYVVRATYTLTSGAIMTVLAMVPKPFAGLPVTAPLPRHESKLPEGVIAWAIKLGDEVKTGVSSISGQWQLPPIKQQ